MILPHPELSAQYWAVQLENISDSPLDSCVFDMSNFEETWSGRLRAVRRPEDVWLWHTHPSGNVGPSAEDLRHRVEGVSYLVVALPSGLAMRY